MLSGVGLFQLLCSSVAPENFLVKIAYWKTFVSFFEIQIMAQLGGNQHRSSAVLIDCFSVYRVTQIS